MISQETKDAIEKEAFGLYPVKLIHIGAVTTDANNSSRVAHIKAATKYAEKLEEAEKGLREINTHLGIQPSDGWALSVNQIQHFKEIIESKDQDIADLKDKVIEHNANAASVGAADAEENWAKEKDDLLRDKAYWQLEAQAKYHEITNCKKSHELLESSLSTLNEELIFKRGELAQLKEIAERMAKTLKGLGGIEAWINDRQVKEHFQETVYPALTAYAEWCKQNLK